MQARCDVGPMTQVAVFKRHRGLQTGHLCCYPALLILAKLLQAFMSLLLTSSCLAEPVHPAPLRGLCSSFDSVGLCNLILHGPLMLSHWVSLTLTGRAQYPGNVAVQLLGIRQIPLVVSQPGCASQSGLVWSQSRSGVRVGLYKNLLQSP